MKYRFKTNTVNLRSSIIACAQSASPSRHEFGTKDDNDHNTIGLFTQCLRLVIAVPLSPFGLSRFSIYSRFTFLFGLLVRVFVGWTRISTTLH